MSLKRFSMYFSSIVCLRRMDLVTLSIISPAALIAVSVAGVCGFVQPSRGLAQAVRVWRFVIALLGAAGGLFGVTVGGLGLLIHLSGLTSMGVAYLAPFSEGKNPSILRGRLKEIKFRSPWLRSPDRRNQA